MRIYPDRIYYFLKAGTRVCAVEPTNYGGRGNWVVKRVDGRSAGQALIVPFRALVISLG